MQVLYECRKVKKNLHFVLRAMLATHRHPASPQCEAFYQTLLARHHNAHGAMMLSCSNAQNVMAISSARWACQVTGLGLEDWP